MDATPYLIIGVNEIEILYLFTLIYLEAVFTGCAMKRLTNLKVGSGGGTGLPDCR